MPNETGYQDIASLLARQPGVGERWQKRVQRAAATVQLATYSFGRPIGTSAPVSATYRLANLDRADPDSHRLDPAQLGLQVPPRYQSADFPKVDRTLKGDRLVVAPPPAIEPETGLSRRRAGDDGKSRGVQCFRDGHEDRDRAGARAPKTGRSIRNYRLR